MDLSPTEPFPMQAAAADLAAAAQRARAGIMRGLFGTQDTPTVVIDDRYALLDQLGVGGQGVVWRARDQRLARDVAIKLLRTGESVSASTQAWLRREAKMLSRLAHPNVVTVFDLGVCPSPWPRDDEPDDAVFVVLELVSGEPMQEWIAARHPTAQEILAVLRQAALGIDAVHAVGLVHCDIKPSNILVGQHIVKLADFGLANAARGLAGAMDVSLEPGTVPAIDTRRSWRTSESYGATTAVSSQRVVAGTPLYMAPEQLDGAAANTRTDVYAFAVTMFEMLIGVCPHRGDSVVTLCAAKRRGAPPRPRDASVPRAAYDELARSLSVDPAARHASATALVHAVASSWRTMHRRRNAVAMVAVTAGAIGWAWPTAQQTCAPASDAAPVVARLRTSMLPEAGDAGRRAIERLVEHERSLADTRATVCGATSVSPVAARCLDRLEGRFDAVVERLRALGARDLHRTSALVAHLTDPQACTRGDADPGDVGLGLGDDDDEIERAWAELDRARIAWTAGDVDASLVALDQLVASTKIPALRDEAELVRTGHLLDVGRVDEADAGLRAIYERALAADLPRVATRAAVGVATVAVSRARFDDATRWLRHAESQLERAGSPADLGVRVARTSGFVRLDLGQPEQAREQFTRELELGLLAGEVPADIAAARAHVAIATFVAGDQTNGLEQLRAAHEEFVAELGEIHPAAIDSLANFGQALARAGRRGEARKVLARALELREAAHGTKALSNTKVLAVLADLDRDEGEHASSIVRLREIEEIYDRWLVPDDPQRAENSLALANVLLDAGDTGGAERTLLATRTRFEGVLPPTSPFQVGLLEARARLAKAHGASEVEAALMAEASALADKIEAGSSPDE